MLNAIPKAGRYLVRKGFNAVKISQLLVKLISFREDPFTGFRFYSLKERKKKGKVR